MKNPKYAEVCEELYETALTRIKRGEAGTLPVPVRPHENREDDKAEYKLTGLPPSRDGSRFEL